MIDTRRWVLVEAWLSMGFTVRWATEWEWRQHADRKQTIGQNDNGPAYCYVGNGQWIVQPVKSQMSYIYGQVGSHPTLHCETMEHELAHWMVATDEQRAEINFGMMPSDGNVNGEDMEGRAVHAERVIATIVAASARIGDIAVSGGRAR